MQTKTTSETGWANFVHQYREVPNKNYDSQWIKIEGDSTSSKAATTIGQSMNRGASDVLQPKFDAARSETDNCPTRVPAICNKTIRIRVEMVFYDTEQQMVDRI